ncbi:MAG TPA: hypothetical protein VHO94_03190 [Oscillospiraceae bacterium]|nr:hypothetical protein [Oscillospiraceae bacterium]
MTKYADDLKEIQQQYSKLIHSSNVSFDPDSFYFDAISFVEKCEVFWLSKNQQLSLILDDLTKGNNCFFLSGAIYLNAAENEHYAFSALGDIHILNDPFVRMHGFFANGIEGINTRTISYFRDVYTDTQNILDNFSDEFVFFPIDIMFNSIETDKLKVIEKAYWNVISSLLNTDINSIEEMDQLYSSIDDIEKHLSGKALELLIFYDTDDIQLSLKDRVDKYFNDPQLPMNIKIDDDIQRFYFATFAQISQVLEIILKCLQFNLIPYVRFDVTFRYLLLIGKAFSNDVALKHMLDYSIIGYLLSENINSQVISKMGFKSFSSKCNKNHYTDTVYRKLNGKGNDMHSSHVEDVIKVILETLNSILAL